jgi:hypothetical protein
MNDARTVVVLTSSPGPLPAALTASLHASGFRVLVALMQPPPVKPDYLARVREFGLRYAVNRVIDRVVVKSWLRRRPLASTADEVVPIAGRDWRALTALIARERAVALMSCALRYIIPARVLSAVPLALNVHPGPLPDWRGADPIWWMLRAREPRMGVSVHRLVAAIDEGDVYATRKVPTPRVRLRSTVEIALAKAITESAGAWLIGILDGSLVPVAQTGGRYWPMPSLANRRQFDPRRR